MPAFLTPGKDTPSQPVSLDSITLVYCRNPYQTLGKLRPCCDPRELDNVYFTMGLASIALLNFDLDRISGLNQILAPAPFELWPIKDGHLDANKIHFRIPPKHAESSTIELPSSSHPELKVYTEQICASLQCLWANYGLYFSEERNTLRQIARQACSLIERHTQIQKETSSAGDNLLGPKKANAIKAALVEISAALSYAVTQGTSGALPVLSNRSPFPHHSLLADC